MLIQPTLDTLNRLKLHGMALALSEQLTQSAALSLSFEERLGLLVDRELIHRENRRLARLLQLAQLKERACLEDVDLRARRGIDRAQLASLGTCDWIRQRHNLLVHGATGCGKTFLACALAHQASRQGLSALYLRAPRLFDELGLCHADGSFRKRLAAIAKVEVLVIDDFAIAPIGPRERTDLLELLDDRVGTRSTVLTSQIAMCEARAELVAPATDRLLTHHDAALEQQFFNIAQAQLEPGTPPNCAAADDGLRKSVAVVERLRHFHALTRLL